MKLLICMLMLLVTAQFPEAETDVSPGLKSSAGFDPGVGLELVLRIDRIGSGYSSPAIGDSMIFLTGEKNGLGYIQAFYHNGDPAWERSYGKEWTASYRGSRAAPVLDEGKVYICSGMGDLICYLSADGRELWKKNMVEDFRGTFPTYGFSMPVLINGSNLVVMPGGETNNIIALDKNSGELIWSSKGSGETAGYAPAILIKRGNRKIYAAFTEFTFIGLDADSGTYLWQHDLNFKGELPCNSPVYENGHIYIGAGPGNGTKKLMLSENGEHISLQWENLELNSAFGGFISEGDFLVGSADYKQSYVLLEKESGRIKSRARIGRGSVIHTSDPLIAYTQAGELLLFELENERLEILHRQNIQAGTGEHFSLPVFRDKLFVRHGDALLIYELY